MATPPPSPKYAQPITLQQTRTQMLLWPLLGGTPNPPQDVSSLRRPCVWENIVLKVVICTHGIEITAQHDPSTLELRRKSAVMLKREVGLWYREEDGRAVPAVIPPAGLATRCTPLGLATGAIQDQLSSTTPGSANTSSTSTEVSNAFRHRLVGLVEGEQPRDKNTKRLKHLVSQIPRASAPFFQSMV
ncbi:hypothetical protein LXA43DRAFT_1101952 [Ganoderma leucocontextum]|nr:hypothetical protein LXA43DRAFT_1101952 [Ganoderma leucocontextum]